MSEDQLKRDLDRHDKALSEAYSKWDAKQWYLWGGLVLGIAAISDPEFAQQLGGVISLIAVVYGFCEYMDYRKISKTHHAGLEKARTALAEIKKSGD